MADIPPTVFHITHWKAGSQWVAEILKQSAPERFVPWKIVDAHANGGKGISNFRIEPLVPGQIYGTLYIERSRFQRIVFSFFWGAKERIIFGRHRALSNWWKYKIKRSPYRAFLITRDLRDTLVSFYFSTKFSHEISADIMVKRKQTLNGLSEEDGLMYLLDEVLPGTADIQTSWIGAPGVFLLRYEDILGNEHVFFERLVEYCQIDVSRERLYDIVRYNIFDAATGRKRGQEDVNAHLRKGITGDWRNHFTDKIKLQVKKQYGQLLIDMGYEKDLNW